MGSRVEELFSEIVESREIGLADEKLCGEPLLCPGRGVAQEDRDGNLASQVEALVAKPLSVALLADRPSDPP